MLTDWKPKLNSLFCRSTLRDCCVRNQYEVRVINIVINTIRASFVPKHKQNTQKVMLAGSPPPTVRLKSSRYQPSRAELDEVIQIDATPEELAKAAVKQVRIDRDD